MESIQVFCGKGRMSIVHTSSLFPKHTCFLLSQVLSTLSYRFISMFLHKKKLISNSIFDIPNKNFENWMGDFWAESVSLALPATERFSCALGLAKSRMPKSEMRNCRGGKNRAIYRCWLFWPAIYPVHMLVAISDLYNVFWRCRSFRMISFRICLWFYLPYNFLFHMDIQIFAP